MDNHAVELLAHQGLEAPAFTLKGLSMWGRVVAVYDGDTFTAALPIFGSVYKFPMRLNGIDTAEIKSKQVENKAMAIRARNRLLQLIGVTIGPNDDVKKKDIELKLAEKNYVVWIECDEQDKYGRILCRVYKDPLKTSSYADILLQEKLAYAYGGGTKLNESEQIDAFSAF